MNNETQTPPPDFGFILGQDQPQPKPKKSKKTIVLITIAIVLVLLTAGLVAFVPDKSAKNEKTVIPSVGAPSAEMLTKEFMTSIQDNQPTKTFSLLSTDYQNTQNLETFTKYFVGPMNNNVDITTCVYAPIDTTRPNDHIVTCGSKKSTAKIIYTITTKTTTENGTNKVTLSAITWKFDRPLTEADVK